MSTGGPIRLLDLGGLPPLHTQAVYHVLAEGMVADRPDTVVLTWPTSPYLCLGFHQAVDDVLDLDRAAARGLPVVRRRVGGGLTYLDADQVFYQFVFHHRRAPAAPLALYRWLLSVPVAALRRLGSDARLQGANEIEVGDRRVAGIGAARIGEATVVVGNVLLDFDYDAMIDVWRHPGSDAAHLAAGALRDRVTTLRALGVEASRADVVRALATEVEQRIGRPVERGALTPEEQAALEPVAQRLSNPGFVAEIAARNGRPPPLKISARAWVHRVEHSMGGERVLGDLLLVDDVITEAHLTSEGPEATDWRHVQACLVGQPLGAWAAVVERARAGGVRVGT